MALPWVPEEVSSLKTDLDSISTDKSSSPQLVEGARAAIAYFFDRFSGTIVDDSEAFIPDCFMPESEVLAVEVDSHTKTLED